MDVTIAMIAEKAGVSRGTVDRVVHNRGRVNPETAERIRGIMQDMNYQPNLLGRAFALSRQKIKLGVVASFKEPDFQAEVMRGVLDASSYAEQYGYEVISKIVGIDDSQACYDAIKQFRAEHVSGIALKGIVHDESIQEIKAMRNEGVKVVTFNNDMDESLRDCFVGQNHSQSGKCAAFLMNQICREPGEILIVGVSPQHKASSERIASFCKLLEQDHVQLGDVQYCCGKNSLSYEQTKQYLVEHPRTVGIFVSGAGLSGVCRAISELGAAGRIKVIGFDTIQPNTEYLRNGIVQFLIDQNPYEQGYRSVCLLTESLFFNREISEPYWDTGIEIKCSYNL